jgi:acyl-CoA thioesterase-1
MALAALASLPAAPALAAPKVVTILGDSITAGLGLPAKAALPAQLQVELRKLGADVVVRGAGVSGDTTGNGLARVDFSVRPDTAVCVVALGANDMMQGIEPAVVRANLDRIVRRLKARKNTVVLAGMHAPLQMGGTYSRQFNAVFADLAKAHGVAFYPALLAGVMGAPQLNQDDGVHPNAAGARIIARKLAPVVAKALNGR